MDNITEFNTTPKHYWFFKAEDLKPGYSAVLSENYLTFYTIHLTAIILIIASLISCPIVIASILIRGSKVKLDFSDRFPLYLSISDFLWGLSHLMDHLILVVGKVYPQSTIATVLGMNLWFFLSYQQMMHAGLATYIYLKVVKRRYINLGRWEWKLHACCIGITVSSIAVFLPLGSFGNSGYWFLNDPQTTAGRVLGINIAICVSVQALCTTFGYSAIIKKLSKQNKATVLNPQDNKYLSVEQHRPKKRRHSTATQCLTTFVKISLALYCTTAVATWSLALQICAGIVEPFSVFIVVIVVNSSGWANAMGYFYNSKLKAKRAAKKTSDLGPANSNISVSSMNE